MENTYFTNFKKQDKYDCLKLYAPDLQDQLPYLNDLVLVNNIDEATASVEFISEDIYRLNFLQTRDECSLTLNSHNLQKILKSYDKVGQLNPLVHKVSTSRHSTYERFSKLNFSVKEFIQEDILETILNSFRTCHLFLHFKGEINSQHFTIDKKNYFKESIAVEEFNLLLKSLQKSKNKSFGQVNFEASNFSILGLSQGRDYRYSNFTMILFFSRDSFLTLSEEELHNFDINIDKVALELKYLIDRNEINEANVDSKMLITSLFGDKNAFDKLNKSSFNKTLNTQVQKLIEEEYNPANSGHMQRILLLGELLNTLKHELSNPLFGLQLSSELLSLEELSEENHLFIDQIKEAVERSQKILENLLSFFTPNEDIVEFNVISLLNKVFTLTKSESRNIRKTIFLEDKICSDTELLIKNNSTSLAQIFFNLVLNSTQAINHSTIKNPYIHIYIYVTELEYIFKIVDNGDGIKKENIDKCFDPFFTTKSDGTGLGLAISNHLANSIGGKLLFIPSKVGAIFELRILK